MVNSFDDKPIAMTLFYKLTTVTLTLLGSAVMANGQATAHASASATVVIPIAIEKTADMSFGNLSVDPTTGGTVTIEPSGSRSYGGGVTLPAISGDVTQALFTVRGSDLYSFNISLPSTVTLTRSSGSEVMIASAFTSNPSGSGILNTGTQQLAIGATLTVGAAQAPGTYVSSAFDVTVNYN